MWVQVSLYSFWINRFELFQLIWKISILPLNYILSISFSNLLFILLPFLNIYIYISCFPFPPPIPVLFPFFVWDIFSISIFICNLFFISSHCFSFIYFVSFIFIIFYCSLLFSIEGAFIMIFIWFYYLIGNIHLLFFDFYISSNLLLLASIFYFSISLFDNFFIKSSLFCGIITFFIHNLFYLYLGLELFTMSTIILLLFKFYSNSKVVSFYYFLFNCFSSLIFLAFLFFWYSFNLFDSNLFLFSFLFKLSLFPFHFLLPYFYNYLSSHLFIYFNVFVQAVYFFLFFKLIYYIPFSNFYLFTMSISPSPSFSFFLIGCTTVFVSLFVFNETSFRRIFAYSSILNSSFLFLFGLFDFSFSFFICSLIIYFINCFNLLAISFSFRSQFLYIFLFCLSLFSFIGFPPFAGFFFKFFLFSSFIFSHYLFLLFFILFFNLLFIVFYLRILNSPLLFPSSFLPKDSFLSFISPSSLFVCFFPFFFPFIWVII